MADQNRGRFFVKLFSSAILMQALLSATNLGVGMLLIRHASDAEYGYYVLVTVAILLMTSIQTAYIQPSTVVKLTQSVDDPQVRGTFVASLYRDQRTWLPVIAATVCALAVGARLLGLIDYTLMFIVMAGAAAVAANLFREFFRMILLAYRRPAEVVRGDLVYVAVLLAGAVVAIFSPAAAAITAGSLAVAAVLGGKYQKWSLIKHEPWNHDAPRGALLSIYDAGMWAVVGAAIHWSFTQGYNYIVAGILSVDDVAAIAATRILMMPVNLVSAGVSSFMFPTVAGWLRHHSVPTVLKRIYVMTLALIVGALLYLGVLWLIRDWIFAVVLKKHFANRDHLLQLWSVICIAMILRDQLAYTLIAHQRFRHLSFNAAVSALVAISCSVVLMRQIGQVGALYGILAGETLSVLGIVLVSWWDARRPSPILKTHADGP